SFSRDWSSDVCSSDLWSYHRLMVLETLKEAWVSDLKGLRNQASFSAVLWGKCPSFASAFSMGKARALSQFIFLFISFFFYNLVFAYLVTYASNHKAYDKR